MKWMMICLSAGLAVGCGGSKESADASPKAETAHASVVATDESKPRVDKPAPAPAVSTPAPTVSAPKKNADPPGLVLPDDDDIGGKTPELPIR